MSTRMFVLRHDQPDAVWSVTQSALRFATELRIKGCDVAIRVGSWEPKRSNEQNALMWSLLTTLAEQVEWPVDGRLVHMEPEEWKDVLTAGLTKHQRVASGIDGGFVLLGRRTSRMTVKQMAELVELIYAFGAERGVRFPAAD